LKLFLADKGEKTSTPIESLFKDEIYKSNLKESPDKIVSDDEIAKILNLNNTTNQKANPLLSGLFSKPKTIAEQQEENSNRRAEIRSNLLKSSKDKASGLFSI
jgi:CO dehydrogenase/acetyl-CoA synthase beta subunit